MSITKKASIIFILFGCYLTATYASKRIEDTETSTVESNKVSVYLNRETSIFKGITLLPRYSNHEAETFDFSRNYFSNWDETKFSLDALKKKISTRAEMEKLSQKLGFTIRDTTNLKLYKAVSSWLGTRYKWGGSGKKGIDCSGYADAIYSSVYNIKIPRKSTIIAQCADKSIPFNALKPGDLVFFSTFHRKYINHVGIYLGDNYFTHSSIKRGVIVTQLKGYYKKVWRKGGRYLNE